MTSTQKVVKYCAIALAVLLIVSIVGGMLQALGWLGGWLTGDDAVGDTVAPVEVGASHTELCIDIIAATLNVTVGDAWAVETNLKGLKVETEDGALELRDTTRRRRDYDGAVLNVTVPRDVTLREVEITTGAGAVNIVALSAERLEMELGAGAVKIGTLQVSGSAEIETGAGEFSVREGSIRDLTLHAGVGKINASVALLGNCTLEFGIGDADLTLLGSAETYTVDAKRGIGTCTVDGRKLSNGETYGSGANRIRIEGGIGSVSVGFASVD